MNVLSRGLYLQAIGNRILAGESIQTFPLGDIDAAKDLLPPREEVVAGTTERVFAVVVRIEEDENGLVSFVINRPDGAVVGKGAGLCIADAAVEMGSALYEVEA